MCPDTFPPVAGECPVYITHSPLLRVRVVAADGTYTPQMVAFEDLSPALILRLAGRPILSFLVTPTFDALDVASVLQSAGHSGRYVAVASDLPDPDLVRREILSWAPRVDFDVFGAGFETLPA